MGKMQRKILIQRVNRVHTVDRRMVPSCNEQTLIMRLVFTIIIINIITKLWLFSLLRSEPALTPWLCLSWLQTIHQQEKLRMKIVWLSFNRLMASSWPCFLSMMHILDSPSLRCLGQWSRRWSGSTLLSRFWEFWQISKHSEGDMRMEEGLSSLQVSK